MTNTKTLDTRRSLLLVDDDHLILFILNSALTQAGYHVSSVESVDEAEVWLENNERPDLVILDVSMPSRGGLELTKRLAEPDNIPFIILTSHSDRDIVAQATSMGAMSYLVKPVDITRLMPAIETALSGAQELQSLRNAKQQLQTALDANRAVSIAVGIIMVQHQVNHDAALDLLRKTARSQHIKMVELALSIINARETLNLRDKA